MTALDSLTCFGCGTLDHSLASSERSTASSSLSTMLRASISRRAEHMESPPPRARSQERFSTTDKDRAASPTTTASSESHTTVSSSSRRLHGRPLQLHHRAMSDPFDAQEADEEDHPRPVATKTAGSSSQSSVLPTMPRYPMAATRNRNCWSEPPIDLFKVRSKDYWTNGKRKIQSGPFIMQARGCDLLLCSEQGPAGLWAAADDLEEDQVVGTSSRGSAGVSMVQDKLHWILEGRLRSKPTLAINFEFPWGVMVLYWQVPPKLAPYMTDQPIPIDTNTLTVPEQTMAKWLMGDNDYKNERLKLIPLVAEGPWVVRKLVTGTPAIIGKKLPVQHVLYPGSTNSSCHHHQTQQPLIMSTLDIGSGSATAKRIVSVCRRYMSALTVDIGLVIQGETQEELPEQMLGSIRIHGPDPLKALHISR